MNQRKRVLEYIQRFGSISPLEALRDLGIMRLASRIFELRELGYQIIGKVEIGKNRYGESIHYMRYSMGE